MKWAALIAWVLTAGGGFVLLTIWLARGGMGQGREGGSRIRPPLILSHFLLAATGLVIWLRRRQARGAVAEAVSPSTPAEQHFPVSIVGLHGVLAVTTVVLVFLTAGGGGGGGERGGGRPNWGGGGP